MFQPLAPARERARQQVLMVRARQYTPDNRVLFPMKETGAVNTDKTATYRKCC